MTSRSGGKRRRWGYVFVFLATPIVALPFLLLASLGLGVDLPSWAMAHPKPTAFLALTLPMVTAFVVIRIYYWRQDARRAEPLNNGV
jgi:hypothetical protein